MERLVLIGLWVVHGGIYGMLSFVTVVSYLIVGLVKYESSDYSSESEMGIVLGVYTLVQFGFFMLGSHYLMDTIMFLVAQEVKDICENYGMFCSEYGILDTNNSGDDFSEADGTSLAFITW